MSSICRICQHEMPKNRRGYEQVCPKCREIGYKELWDKDMLFNDIDKDLLGIKYKIKTPWWMIIILILGTIISILWYKYIFNECKEMSHTTLYCIENLIK